MHKVSLKELLKDVPSVAKWVAMDRSGMWYWYAVVPLQGTDTDPMDAERWWCSVRGSGHGAIGVLPGYRGDWKKSLRKVTEPEPTAVPAKPLERRLHDLEAYVELLQAQVAKLEEQMLRVWVS